MKKLKLTTGYPLVFSICIGMILFTGSCINRDQNQIDTQRPVEVTTSRRVLGGEEAVQGAETPETDQQASEIQVADSLTYLNPQQLAFPSDWKLGEITTPSYSAHTMTAWNFLQSYRNNGAFTSYIASNDRILISGLMEFLPAAEDIERIRIAEPSINANLIVIPVRIGIAEGWYSGLIYTRSAEGRIVIDSFELARETEQQSMSTWRSYGY
jgi:hypothetical protein